MYSFVDIPIAGRVNSRSWRALRAGGDTRLRVLLAESRCLKRHNDHDRPALRGEQPDRCKMAAGVWIRGAHWSGFSSGYRVVARDERVVFGVCVVGGVFDEDH